MNLGYYFHVSAVFDADGVARLPAHYAMFVRGLADTAGQVTLYAHSTEGDGTETDRLDQPNIRSVSLGPRASAPVRAVLPAKSLRAFRPKDDGLDAMIVRSPTSLLAGIVRRCRRAGVPVLPMFVDEFRKWRPSRSMPSWRNAVMPVYGWIHLRQIRRVMRTMPTAAIARAIYVGHNPLEPHDVFTATVTDADLATFGQPHDPWPAGLGKGVPVRLLFTGRFAEEKGLFELVDALRLLRDEGIAAELELVGYASADRTIDTLQSYAQERGVRDALVVTGFVPAGPELLSVYRRCHLYVLPTHGEGSVPRTIKEAMSTRTPVITTTIPHIIEHLEAGREALLVPPHDAAALAGAIKQALGDERATRERAEHAFAWASRLTNERSAQTVVDLVKDIAARA